MPEFDNRMSIGHQPRWRQVLYSVECSIPRPVERLWRAYTVAAAILLPIVLFAS